MHTKATISTLSYYEQIGHSIDMLRLDLVHPIVSGNKWYKLSKYIQDAKSQKATHLASFGGPYSNHIVALAYAGKQMGIKTIGYIRSNYNEPITPSLQDAIQYGMQLEFLGRSHFQENKNQLLKNQHNTSIYFIDEGGYGILGAIGFESIKEEISLSHYDYIMAAVGTGTMLAGLIRIGEPHQQIIGIPVLKNEGTIAHEIKALLPNSYMPYTLMHQFHQGGYAKTSEKQIHCMNLFWKNNAIATDIVYTGKLITAMDALLSANYFDKKKKLLLVHSGGLQGNRSLATGILHF